MKILIVGAWAWPQYEEAFAYGLRENGHEVTALAITHFFSGFWGRMQQAIPFPGLALLRINRAVIKAVKKQAPDLVLFWRPTHILPATVRILSRKRVLLASYNNDDPFGPKLHGKAPWHHAFLWHWYIRCLPLFNYNFFYRSINCAEARAIGASHSEVLLPYFIPSKDKPVELTHIEQKRFSTEVVFVGHYESDGRENRIRAIMNAGIKMKIWGGGYWSRNVLGELYDRLSPIVPAAGDDYAKALCGAKICLVFLSKLNRDTYTRRCFEIPACGQLMLAERTADLTRMFKEDKEACFFSSNDELVEKARYLLSNPQVRERIAQAGMQRVWSDAHDVQSRAKQFLFMLSNNS